MTDYTEGKQAARKQAAGSKQRLIAIVIGDLMPYDIAHVICLSLPKQTVLLASLACMFVSLNICVHICVHT
jgi:hypothetical protein